MTNDLYGTGFIEKLVSSGYKNPTYAMAEIIDNSVDAQSKNIDIILVEEIKKHGGRDSRFISDVFFIDDGKGMNYEEINGCLKFSEGAGTTNSRIGTFGVGLPNSSIFVGRRVEVYSKDKSTGNWNYVFLDLDDQATRSEAGYDTAEEKEPNFIDIDLGIDLSNISTIIRWSKIRNIGAKKPQTVIRNTSRLIGRLYRYILDEINISFGSVIKGNKGFEQNLEKVLPFDPLFLKETKTQITERLWEVATTSDSRNRKIVYSDKVTNNEKFNTQYHYKKYIKGCIENQTNRPLFQKHDNYWDLQQPISINGKIYYYTIRASFATKNIAHPGIRNGGRTYLADYFKEKMVGTKHSNGGNISFIRTKREIQCGSFGLYPLTNEKERFWTIEIEFDSSLDKLMGLDYQKQNVTFKFVDSEDVSGLENSLNLGINEQQLLLFHKISQDITECRKQMMKILKDYAKEFKQELEAAIGDNDGGGGNPLPEAEPAVIRALPIGDEWTLSQKEDLTRFLKKNYMSIPEELISKQVEKFSKGLHKTIVLYNADETGNLFEITTIRGKRITFINTNHIFYQNIIEPLKENKQLNVFTSAIEMLLCAYAYEMDLAVTDDPSKEILLKNYLRKISDRLQEFINDGQVQVDTEYWKKKMEKIEEQDESEEQEI